MTIAFNQRNRKPSDRPVVPFHAAIPSRTPLDGSEVVLEPLAPGKHGEHLYQASHQNSEALKIWDYLAYGPYPSVEIYQDALSSQSSSFDPIYFALIDKKSGQAFGQASYLEIDATLGTIEIGHIWFSPVFQQTRAATEALFLLMRHAMDDLNYRRIQWRCNALNQKSLRAAVRIGFQFEGIFYNHMHAKGRNRDTAFFSIIAEEWQERKKLIAEWLSDDNFDPQGLARTSLFKEMNKL